MGSTDHLQTDDWPLRPQEDIAERSVSRSLGLRITAVIAMMDGQASDPMPVASSTSKAPAAKPVLSTAAGRAAPVVAPAAAPATSRRELQTLQLNMDNLLGCREQVGQGAGEGSPVHPPIHQNALTPRPRRTSTSARCCCSTA